MDISVIDNLYNWLSPVGVIISFVGIMIAFFQIKQSNKSTKVLLKQIEFIFNKAEETVKVLDSVSNALSTRYIGPFPLYLEVLPNLLSKATSEILVCYISPTPGIFSNIHAWLDIREEISKSLRQKKNISVKAVFGKDNVVQLHLQEQFSSNLANWDNFLSNKENNSKLSAFIGRYGEKHIDINHITQTEFLNTFSRSSEEELRLTYFKSEISYISYRPQIYMWVIDSNEAVFVIPSVKHEFGTYAFWTSDYQIIKALVALHKEYVDSP